MFMEAFPSAKEVKKRTELKKFYKSRSVERLLIEFKLLSDKSEGVHNTKFDIIMTRSSLSFDIETFIRFMYSYYLVKNASNYKWFETSILGNRESRQLYCRMLACIVNKSKELFDFSFNDSVDAGFCSEVDGVDDSFAPVMDSALLIDGYVDSMDFYMHSLFKEVLDLTYCLDVHARRGEGL